jgi:hypothetical protein
MPRQILIKFDFQSAFPDILSGQLGAIGDSGSDIVRLQGWIVVNNTFNGQALSKPVKDGRD